MKKNEHPYLNDPLTWTKRDEAFYRSGIKMGALEAAFFITCGLLWIRMIVREIKKEDNE